MLGAEDLSSRFDYLFEPLDDDGPDAPPAAPSDDGSRARSATPVKMAFAAFVLAMLGGLL